MQMSNPAFTFLLCLTLSPVASKPSFCVFCFYSRLSYLFGHAQKIEAKIRPLPKALVTSAKTFKHELAYDFPPSVPQKPSPLSASQLIGYTASYFFDEEQ